LAALRLAGAAGEAVLRVANVYAGAAAADGDLCAAAAADEADRAEALRVPRASRRARGRQQHRGAGGAARGKPDIEVELILRSGAHCARVLDDGIAPDADTRGFEAAHRLLVGWIGSVQAMSSRRNSAYQASERSR
jgi:hypothetical protein